MGLKIEGVGIYLPNKRLTNFDLEKMVDTSDEWITTRTGIKERRIAEDETTSYMAYKSALSAIERSGISKEEIDGIIVATLSPENQFPSTACLVQEKLGLKDIFAFDLSAACSGFLYGLEVAWSMISAGRAKRILLIGSEKISSIVDWKDRSTCVLFGDGAASVILTNDKGNSDILASKIYSDGSLWKLLYAPLCGYINMKGRELFKVAVRSMEEACRYVLNKAGLSPEDVDLVIPHQANIRIINSLAEKLNIPEEKIYTNIHKYGNTSAASIPIALYEALEEGRLKRGDIVLLTAMGGGLTWGATLLRF